MSVIVERKNQITSILNAGEIQSRIKNLFNKDDAKAEKFKATILNIALDQSISSCTPASIIKSALMIAELDLPLAKGLGQAYIVKYKADAEAQIGYKGWLALAERAGKSVKAKPVFKCDEFELEDNGFDETVKFKPNYDERQEYKPAWVESNLRGVLVAIKDNSTGTVSINFISVGKLKQIAGVSPSVKKGSYSPYTEWGLEMYQGKAIKYILSKTPMNEQIGRAVEIDNQLDMKAIEDKKETSAAIDIDLNAMLAEQPINVEAQEIKDDDIKA